MVALEFWIGIGFLERKKERDFGTWILRLG